eukprot:gene29569-23395_t
MTPHEAAFGCVSIHGAVFLTATADCEQQLNWLHRVLGSCDLDTRLQCAAEGDDTVFVSEEGGGKCDPAAANLNAVIKAIAGPGGADGSLTCVLGTYVASPNLEDCRHDAGKLNRAIESFVHNGFQECRVTTATTTASTTQTSTPSSSATRTGTTTATTSPTSTGTSTSTTSETTSPSSTPTSSATSTATTTLTTSTTHT